MTEKREHVPWQIMVGVLAGIAVTAYAIVLACGFLDGTSARVTASVALAVIVLPTVAVVASIGLFIASAWGNRRQD